MNNTALRGLNGLTASQAQNDPYLVKRNLMEIHGERTIFNSNEVQEGLMKKFRKDPRNKLFLPGCYVFYSVVGSMGLGQIWQCT